MAWLLDTNVLSELRRGAEFYEQRQRDQQLQYLQRKAAQLGFQVLALAETR
jgi:predicted nucleic acid-binding protein